MTTHDNPQRLTAQIACEAIINHEDDGYTLADMRTVFAQACDTGVGDLFVDMLSEQIQALATAADRACSHPYGHIGARGATCGECGAEVDL